jgi:hypothetical protein
MKIGKIILVVIFAFIVVFTFNIVASSSNFLLARSTSGNGTKGLAKATSNDFNDCLILRDDRAVLIIDHKDTEIKMRDLAQQLPSKIKGMSSFNIIATKDANYHDIVQAPGCSKYLRGAAV